MQWFHWHPRARALQSRTERFGSTAVIGLESMRDLDSLRDLYGFEHVRAIPALRAAQVSVDTDELHALLAAAPADRRVRYVSPVGPPRHTLSVPDDPLLQTIDPRTNQAFEWQFAASHVDRALDYSQGDPKIVVGVIDTGTANVPDLAGKIDGLWSAAPDGTLTSQPVSDGNDDYGHGTAVASLIAANVDDGFGMAGFGGATHVVVVHAGNQSVFYDTSIAIALAKLDALGVRIVNMSVGGRSPSEPILVDAIHKASADGMLLVASAGNEHGDVSWPAADLQPGGGGRSYGLAVGATDMNGRLADFSNAGKHLSLVAPGTYGASCSGVLVALPPTNAFQDSYCYPLWDGAGGAHYGYLAGTSFSAPQVAGIAALIWAARPELENYQVADIIKESARRAPGTGWTPTMGCGVLDAGAALELATSLAVGRATSGTTDVTTCSTDGDEPPVWPSEIDQTITFEPLRDRTVGEPDFRISATASSSLPVSFMANGTCTLRRATVHVTGIGTCTVTASQAGNDTYKPAPPVVRTFSITKASRIAATVLALPASGRWGSSVNLSYRIIRGSGDIAASITVQRDRATVAHLAGNFSDIETGRVYSLSWRTPPARKKGSFRFCVTIADHAHSRSAPSCARIKLR